MGPDGILDTGVLQPRNARRLRLVIIDYWSDGVAAIATVTAQ